MTEEQKPGRAYQPWTDQEYELLARLHYTYKMTVNQIAGSICRLPSEVENALTKLGSLNEAMTNKQDQLANGRCNVYKPKTSILSKEDLAGVEKDFPAYLIRRSSRLIINGRNYNLLLLKARKRVHLQIEISAALAGGK